MKKHRKTARAVVATASAKKKSRTRKNKIGGDKKVDCSKCNLIKPFGPKQKIPHRDLDIYRVLFVNTGGNMPHVVLSQYNPNDELKKMYGIESSEGEILNINKGFNMAEIDNIFSYPLIKEYDPVVSKVFVMKGSLKNKEKKEEEKKKKIE